jgi:O-antigen/teichoic acid export membrane protein
MDEQDCILEGVASGPHSARRLPRRRSQRSFFFLDIRPYHHASVLSLAMTASKHSTLRDTQAGHDPCVEPLRKRSFAWGFVDQAASSATNFLLAVLAARLLGPDGLGVVLIGYAAYLLALAFQRAFITEPLVAASAALDSRDRRVQTNCAFTLTLIGATSAGVVILLFGLLLPAQSSQGLIWICAWIIPALVQDSIRAVLFRDGRAAAAAVNDSAWLVVMLAVLPLAVYYKTAWLVVGCWGIGAVASACLGIRQIRPGVANVSDSVRWWRVEAARLGGWLGASTVLMSLAMNGTTFVLSGMLGTKSLGGLRAAQSAFGPLSLLGPALSLPGLPFMVRSLGSSRSRALRVAWQLTAAAAAASVVYTAAFVARPEAIGTIFGPGFADYRNLVLPVAVAQLATSPAIGFGVLLRAEQRGRALFALRVVGTGILFLLISASATMGSIVVVAWAGVIGAVLASFIVLIVALHPSRSPNPSTYVALDRV